jgi:hypothetical protein
MTSLYFSIPQKKNLNTKSKPIKFMFLLAMERGGWWWWWLLFFFFFLW